MIQWVFETSNSHCNSTDQESGKEIAVLVNNLIKETFGTKALTGKGFESACILRHMIMRHADKSLMGGNVMRNITNIDWTNATLRQYFNYRRREGPMNRKIAHLTFDFTKLLPDKWDILGDNEAIKKFFQTNYRRKRSRIGQPLSIDFKSIDYFYSGIEYWGFNYCCGANSVLFQRDYKYVFC